MTYIPDNETVPVPAPEPEPYMASPPCRITLMDGNVFVVEGIDNWAWHQKGIFATGYYLADTAKTIRDRLFFDDAVESVEFYFDAQEGGENNV